MNKKDKLKDLAIGILEIVVILFGSSLLLLHNNYTELKQELKDTQKTIEVLQIDKTTCEEKYNTTIIDKESCANELSNVKSELDTLKKN